MTEGLLFLAKGEKFVNSVQETIPQVHSVMPDTPITLVTNTEINSNHIDKLIIDDRDFSLKDKPRMLQATPYDKTIYLDTDIFLNDSINEIFDMLDDFELALVRDHIEYNIRKLSEPHPLEGVPKGFPEYNSGFMAFKDTPTVMEFFQDWESRIHPNHDYDQRALRPALYDSSLRYVSLPPRYNCLYFLNGCVTGKVKVFHAASGDLEKHIEVHEAISKFEKSNHPRIYQTYEDTIFVDLSPPLHRKVWVSLLDRGPTETARKIINKLTTLFL